MRRQRILVMVALVAVLAGCRERTDGSLAASSISENGFARDREAVRALDGTQIMEWGLVDHGTLSGGDGAREILGQRWVGDGPDADSWCFHPKARADDEVGRSFAVRIPNDEGRDGLPRPPRGPASRWCCSRHGASWLRLLATADVNGARPNVPSRCQGGTAT